MWPLGPGTKCMSDNEESNREEWRSEEPDGDWFGGSEDSIDIEDGEDLTREDWKRLASDPDWAKALGYEVSEWEEFDTLDGSDTSMFLPSDEEVLREDAFVVAEDEAVVDLGKWY